MVLHINVGEYVAAFFLETLFIYLDRVFCFLSERRRPWVDAFFKNPIHLFGYFFLFSIESEQVGLRLRLLTFFRKSLTDTSVEIRVIKVFLSNKRNGQ